MKANAAILPAWLALLAISGFVIQNASGARVSVKQRRSLTTNADFPNQSNQMYMNTRSTSRYQPIEYETSESIRSDSYVDSANDEPYRFSYMVDDQSSNMQFRSEQRMPGGAVRGSYGFRDANGVYRLVEYVADETGFHAKIHTNEPGVRVAPISGPITSAQNAALPAKLRNRNPANVQLSFDKEPDMSEWFGRRRLPAYSYTSDTLDQYRAAASQIQPSDAQPNNSHDFEINRKSSTSLINTVQNKPTTYYPSVTLPESNEPNEFATRLPPNPKRRMTILKRVYRPFQEANAKQFAMAKFQTRPSSDSHEDPIDEARPVFNPNDDLSKQIPDSSITKPRQSSQYSSYSNPTTTTEASPTTTGSATTIDLQEFSQKYPDKWQRILVAKQPELNVFGEKIGWPNDRLHRLELEQGVFGHKLHRLVNEQPELGSSSSSSLTGRSVGAKEVKRTQRAPSVQANSNQKSASGYVPPLNSFGSVISPKVETLISAASSPKKIAKLNPNIKPNVKLEVTTLLPPTTTLPIKEDTMVTMVSMQSSVSMSTSKSSKSSSDSSAPSSSTSNTSSQSSTVLPTTESTTLASTKSEVSSTVASDGSSTTTSQPTLSTNAAEPITIAKVIKQ